MARFKEVELKRHGCVSLVSRMYPDDTLFDYVVYVNANGKIHSYGFVPMVLGILMMLHLKSLMNRLPI